MWRSISIFLGLYGLAIGILPSGVALAESPVMPVQPVVKSTAPATIDFQRHFEALKVEGSIVIYDLKNDRTYEHNPKRNTTEFLPASTFKIVNSLIALENAMVPNELAILTWDGIERSIPSWNQDLNMQEAFKRSAIWFYQVLARRIGPEKMQQGVTKLGYGNQNIGSPSAIDQFWLDGDLRITPMQQIDFLKRFYQGQLPVSKRSLEIVKAMMILEQTPNYILRGKTGWVGLGDPKAEQIGWLVGYLEAGNNVYFFATNLDLKSPKDAPMRMTLTRLCLKDLGVLQ